MGDKPSVVNLHGSKFVFYCTIPLRKFDDLFIGLWFVVNRYSICMIWKVWSSQHSVVLGKECWDEWLDYNNDNEIF